MRSFCIGVAIAVVATACVTSGPSDRDRYDRRYGDRQQTQVFDATLPDGSFVRVEQDQRSGDMVILEPLSVSGQHVVMVNPNGNAGMPLVAFAERNYQRRDDRRDHDARGRDDDRPEHR
ncbi:MAG TPA: hypothetical protein VFA79_13605 [Myxococcales bacterium]|nr:hypothetical protein [Myxococcales bacterium]